MPRATSVKTDIKRVDLKTCPPDGYVVIRRLDYGEKLRGGDMAAHIEQLVQAPQSTNGKSQADEVASTEDYEEIEVEGGVKQRVTMVSTATQPFVFARSIVEHNLEDGDGNPLDFRKRADVLRLDSVIAEEIEKEINAINAGGLGKTPASSSEKLGE